MSYLYVSEQGASIGIEANRFQVKYKDGMIKSIPAETLEMIEVFGSVQITTRCLTECLKRGVNIPVLFHKRGVLWKADLNFPCECAKTAYSGGNWTQ